MKEDFVKLVEDVAFLVRKRNLRELGKSPIIEYLPTIFQKRLLTPTKDSSPILVGNALLEIVIEAIEKKMKPDDMNTDSPVRRNYVYLSEFIIQGKERNIIASESLHISRSIFFEIQQAALDTLAIVLWELEREEEKMINEPSNNLGHDMPYTTEFIERFNEEGQNYIDDIFIPLLRNNIRPYIIGIIGNAGVGKSSIAYAIADRAVHDKKKYKLPFDAVIWISFKSPDILAFKYRSESIATSRNIDSKDEDKVVDQFRKKEINRLLSTFYDEICTTLGYRGNFKPATVEEKRNLAENQIRKYACLFVIDNLDSDYLVPREVINAIFEFMTSLPSPNKALFTLRKDQKERSLKFITVERMTFENAKKFLVEQAALRNQIVFNESDFKKVYDKTNGNPLALKFALGLVQESFYTVDEAIDFRTFGKEMLEHMYGMSYLKLPENAQKTLLVMPIFSDVAAREAIENACGISGAQETEMLSRLFSAHMIEKKDPTPTQDEVSYSLLPLPREFVYKKWEEDGAYIEESSLWQFLKEARSKLTNYYIERLESVKDRKDRGIILMKNEKKNFINILSYCDEYNDERLVKILELTGMNFGTFHYLDIREHWGRKVVKMLEDKRDFEKANWYSIRDVAWSISRSGTKESREEAKKLFEHASSIARSNGWEKNYALANTNLTRLKGDGKTELENLDESKQIFERLHEEFWLNVTLRVTADLLLGENKIQQSVNIYNELFEKFTTLHDINGLYETESAIAYAMARNNQVQEAKGKIDENVERINELINHPSYSYAYCLTNQAKIYRIIGNQDGAKKIIIKAINEFELLGMTYWVDFWQKWQHELQQLN